MTTGNMLSNSGHMMGGFPVFLADGQEAEYVFSPKSSETSNVLVIMKRRDCEY